VFTPYSKIWKNTLQQNPLQEFASESLVSNFLKTPLFPFPKIEELGFSFVKMNVLPPLLNENTIKNYHETRNVPAANGTSNLSVHLRFGTVSIRNLVEKALQWNETWLNELIWREFFMMILFHYPKVVTHCFKPKYEAIEWRNNATEFEQWCRGETGYPLVDAGMRQLNQTGLMHNRVRMVVASFLTKHLQVDWRWGEAYFAQKLLDYDLSANNGNWQWAAGCGCDAAPYFRVFNPTEQAKKFDPQETYIKTWIEQYHPLYLPPMVEHSFARKRALETYAKAMRDKI
jgi:deoxyribodipyrimidine photo-lyase